MLRDLAPNPAAGRLPSLDGIRAIAITLVLYSHACGGPGFPTWLQWPLPDGGAGVRIFFVLSGFLITSLLIGEANRSGRVSLPAFYRRRAVRILPAYWAFLLFVAVLGLSGAIALRPLNVLMPLTFTNGFWFWPTIANTWVTAHTWSLAVEEQFYLAWPISFAVATAVLPRRSAYLTLLGGLAVLLVAGPIARSMLYVRPRWAQEIYAAWGNFDILAWGCALAVARHLWPRSIDRILSWRPAWGRLTAVVVVLYAQPYFARAFGFPYGWTAWGLQAAAFAYLIGSLIHIRCGLSYRLLNTRPAIWLGLLSYSLYLWQEPFLQSVTGHNPAWQCWPLNLAIVVIAAFGSYRLIEVPMRRFRGGPRQTPTLTPTE